MPDTDNSTQPDSSRQRSERGAAGRLAFDMHSSGKRISLISMAFAMFVAGLAFSVSLGPDFPKGTPALAQISDPTFEDEEDDDDTDHHGVAPDPPEETCSEADNTWPPGDCISHSNPIRDEDGNIIGWDPVYREIINPQGEDLKNDLDCTGYLSHHGHSHALYNFDSDGDGQYDVCAAVENCEESDGSGGHSHASSCGGGGDPVTPAPVSCPPGWTEEDGDCIRPTCPAPLVFYDGRCGDPTDFTLDAPEGLAADCADDGTGTIRVRYSWDPVPGAAGYHLYGTVWRATDIGTLVNDRGTRIFYQGTETSAFPPAGLGDQWRLQVRQYIDAIPGVSATLGPLSDEMVTGYCMPAPENVSVVCARAYFWYASWVQPSFWAKAVGVSYDAHAPSTGYEVEGTVDFSYGVNRDLLAVGDLGLVPTDYERAVYLRGSADWVHRADEVAEGSAVSVRVRRDVHGMLSEWSQVATGVCPVTVERVFAQCAFGSLDVRWPALAGTATVNLAVDHDHGHFETVNIGYGFGSFDVWRSVWREASTSEHAMAGGAGSLSVAVAEPDPVLPHRVRVTVGDDNNKRFTREPTVQPLSGPDTWFHRFPTSFPAADGAAQTSAFCADAVTGLDVECPAPHSTVTVSWDAYPSGTVLRYEAEEDGGTLAAYSGTATSFDRTSPVGDVYRWRARAVLDDGAGGETLTPWTPWFEQECPPDAPEAPTLVCVAGTGYTPPTVIYTQYGSYTVPGRTRPAWGLDGSWAADSRARRYEYQDGEDGDPASVGGVRTANSVSEVRVANLFIPSDPDKVGGQLRLRAFGDGGSVSEWGPWADYQCLPDDFEVECPAPHSTVTVSWGAYTGPGTLLRYEAEESGDTLTAYSGTATSFTRASATADAYSWRARMVYDDGAGGETVGPWTLRAEQECPPVKPTGLSATCAAAAVPVPGYWIYTQYGNYYVPPSQSPGWAIVGAWDADSRAVRYQSQREEDPLPAPQSVSGTTLRADLSTTDNSAGRIRIRALGNGGTMSEWSDWAPYECLAVPTGLTVDCGTGTTITVAWDADPNAAGYEAEEDGGDLASYSGTANTFTRTAVMGETYRWRVRAQFGSLWSQWSDWVEATCGQPPTGLRVACTAGGTTPAVLSASWDAISWATGYEAEEDGGNLTSYTGTAVSFTDTTASVNTRYRWRVRATGPGGMVSPWSAWVADTCPPAAPLNLNVQCGPAPSSRTLTVDWAASPGARDYQIEASATSAAFTPYYGTATGIGRLGAWGATYELRVRAWSVAGGWSNWTAYDSATCPFAPQVVIGPLAMQCAWDGTAGTNAAVHAVWDTTGDDIYDSYEFSYREYKWSHLTTPTGSTTVSNASPPYSFTPSSNDVVVEAKLVHTEQVVDPVTNMPTGAVNTNDSGWGKVWCGAPMPTLRLTCMADVNTNGDKMTSSTLNIIYSLNDPYPAMLPHPVKFSFQTQILDWGREAETWGSSVWSDTSHHPVFESPTSSRHPNEWTGTPPGSQVMDPQLSEPPAPADDATLQIPSGDAATGQVTVQHRMSGYTYRVWAKTSYWLPGADSTAGHTTGIIGESTVTCEASDCVASTVTDRRQVEWNLLFDIYEPAHDAADRPTVHPDAANQNGDPNCCAEQSDSPIGVGQVECTRRCSILATYSYWSPRQRCVHRG